MPPDERLRKLEEKIRLLEQEKALASCASFCAPSTVQSKHKVLITFKVNFILFLTMVQCFNQDETSRHYCSYNEETIIKVFKKSISRFLKYVEKR